MSCCSVAEAALRPYMTMDPDWRTIFEDDEMTLTCNVPDWLRTNDDGFYWYKNNEQFPSREQKLYFKKAKMSNSGEYQCKTSTSDKSEPVQLDVSRDWLILQTPAFIHEGDRMNFNCRGWDGLFSYSRSIFKDGRIISNGHTMDKTGTGWYHCTRNRITTHFIFTISFLDLFSVPVLTLIPPVISEGDELTMTCDTILSPRRWNTKLQFVFYRNDQILRDSGSNVYTVPSAQLQDSGKYSCEVLGPVRKKSDNFVIEVQELFQTPVMQVSPSSPISKGEQVVLRCVTTGSHLLYSFFKDSKTLRDYTTNNSYLIPRAGEDHSGNYQCSSRSTNHRVLKYSEVIKVVVEYGSMILLPEQAVVGDRMTLRCECSFSSTQFRFYHNRTILQTVAVHPKRSTEITRIIKSAAMTGPYYCDVQSPVSAKIWQSQKVNLFILDPVANITITMSRDGEDFVVGESVTLTCSIQRGTSPTYLWFHDDEVVEHGSMFYHLEDNQKHLHIDSLQTDHKGAYHCKATNNLGSRIFSISSPSRSINVMEPTQTESLVIALGVLLLTILVVVLTFIYRQKVSSCVFAHLKTERTQCRSRTAQDPANDFRERSPDIGEEEYSNIPPRGQDVHEELCYVHIDIRRANKDSPHLNTSNEEASVTYSAVRFPQSTSDPQTTQETRDCNDLYQNFKCSRPPS
ncbi:hypothetical protein GDO81_014841 [Engystomops pustulosus]|uniref:Ig-like domain-containing protein n=1 Tax=Engystomops pustulosus TaxID=76066 RepID=A0AAV7AFM2_ENGPU|nr:hypothetical protein GDO81_014841 [Engystomops pustulosus]